MAFKHLLFFGLVAILHQASGDVLDLEPGTYTSGAINDYADRVLDLIRPAMIRNGFDPFKVDDISRDFWFKPLFINYTGHIDLNNGWLQDLSTIRRNGDAKIKYEKKMLTIYLDLMVDNLMAHFDYNLRVFNIGPTGLLSAKIRKQAVRFGILVDFERVTFHLQQFALTSNQEVKLHLTGLGLLDPLVGVMVDALTLVLKDPVTKGVGQQIRSALEALIAALPPLLPPPPATDKFVSQLDLVRIEDDLSPWGKSESDSYQL